MRVERIEPVAGLKHSFDVVFDNNEKLRCFTKNIADFGLKPNRELSEERFEELKDAIALSRTRQRAARLISARQMSAGELFRRLIQKGENEENALSAVKWLTEIRALDDAEYARSVARHYSQKGYGKAKIKDELYRRFIPRELWEDALSSAVDMQEAAGKYLKAKLKSENPDRAELRRAADGLLRRGFSWDEIKEALRRYGEEADE